MAAIKQVNIVPAPVPVVRPGDPHVELARLAELHVEARETAILANLLGRAPYAMVALAVAAGTAIAVSAASMPTAQIATWLVLMIAGLGAMARAYGQAIAAPFERPALKSFAQDLTAITLYLGFVWGAGAFLVLPPSSGIFTSLFFAAGMSALFAGLARERNIALCFLAPASLLTAFACVLGTGGALAACLVLIAGGAVAATVMLAARWTASPSPALQPG